MLGTQKILKKLLLQPYKQTWDDSTTSSCTQYRHALRCALVVCTRSTIPLPTFHFGRVPYRTIYTVSQQKGLLLGVADAAVVTIVTTVTSFDNLPRLVESQGYTTLVTLWGPGIYY